MANSFIPQNAPLGARTDAPCGATEEPGAERLAESLARIGVALGAQRVELHRRSSTEVDLVGWWSAQGHLGRPVTVPARQPVEWFPWNLANIRPEAQLFVRNAELLPLDADNLTHVGDLGMRSCVFVPLVVVAGDEAVGGVSAYWATPKLEVTTRQVEIAAELGRDALLDL